MRSRGRCSARRGCARRRAASRESCRRRSRTDRRRPPAARSTISDVVQPGIVGNGNPQTLAQRAAVAGVDCRHAADFGAALHAGVAANRHQAAVRPAGQAAREADVHQRLDRVDAVRVLRQPHRPDEDGVRTIDQQPRECLRSARVERRSSCSMRLPVDRPSASSRAASNPTVCSRTKRLVDRRRLRRARGARRRETRDRRRCARRTSGRPAPSRTARSSRSTAPSSARALARGTD